MSFVGSPFHVYTETSSPSPLDETQLSMPQHLVTTYLVESRAATFSSLSNVTPNDIRYPVGWLNILFTTSKFPPSLLEDDEDYRASATYRLHGLPDPSLDVFPYGTTCGILHIPPRVEGRLLKVQTMDYMVILEGTIEVELDSREVRRLRSGDTLVQRGSGHILRNRTSSSRASRRGQGWASIFFVAIDAATGEVQA